VTSVGDREVVFDAGGPMFATGAPGLGRVGSFFAGEVSRGSTTAVTADAAAGIGKTPELGEGKTLFLGSA
jgi:hypothetical protein